MLEKIQFNIKMSAEDRKNTINEMRKWMEESKASHSKKTILNFVLQYAEEKLIDNPADKRKDRLKICESIFKQADLDDLFFLQHVINELCKIKSKDSPLKKELLPEAQKHKKAYVRPLSHQIWGGAFIVFCVSMYVDKRIAAAAVLMAVLSEWIVEARIRLQLAEIFAKQINKGVVPVIGDGWDPVFEQAGKVGSSGALTAAMNWIGVFRDRAQLPRPESAATGPEVKQTPPSHQPQRA